MKDNRFITFKVRILK